MVAYSVAAIGSSFRCSYRPNLINGSFSHALRCLPRERKGPSPGARRSAGPLHPLLVSRKADPRFDDFQIFSEGCTVRSRPISQGHYGRTPILSSRPMDGPGRETKDLLGGMLSLEEIKKVGRHHRGSVNLKPHQVLSQASQSRPPCCD
jgi:hypothetical protein